VSSAGFHIPTKPAGVGQFEVTTCDLRKSGGGYGAGLTATGQNSSVLQSFGSG
jgi:hypothetical protein